MKLGQPAGLLRTILTRILPFVVAALVVASLVISNYVSRTIRSEARLRLADNAQRATELVAHKLDLQQDYAKTLATNELLVNSLADVQERDRYLPLFFHSLQTPGEAEAQIAMTDYRGRIVASNGVSTSFDKASWIPQVMEGQHHFEISNGGLIVVEPILYAGRPEGMIVLKYQPAALKQLLSVDIGDYEMAIIDSQGNLLSKLASQVPKESLHNDRFKSANWVRHRTVIDRYPSLHVVTFQSTDPTRRRLNEVVSYLGVASVLSLIALIAGTIMTVRMTISPLMRLIEKIKTTHNTSDLSNKLEVQGVTEFQSLASSFNQMLSRLKQTTVSRDHLETVNDQLTAQTAAVEAANLQLSRSNEELKQFAYVASHDLQEPLRKVNSFCQLLTEEHADQLSGDAKSYLDYIVDGSTRMRNLVADLLDYSRVETQGRPLQPTDASGACSEAIENLQESIKEHGAIITVEPLPILQADYAQLVRLFQNLISNAIKYRSEKPPEIKITVEQQKHDWIISIQDNGIGIEPEYFERIFVMFQRLHARNEYSGTGIGLAICKRIVDRLWGQISVKSEPGVGSTFSLSIPKLADLPHEGTTEHARRHTAST